MAIQFTTQSLIPTAIGGVGAYLWKKDMKWAIGGAIAGFAGYQIYEAETTASSTAPIVAIQNPAVTAGGAAGATATTTAPKPNLIQTLFGLFSKAPATTATQPVATNPNSVSTATIQNAVNTAAANPETNVSDFMPAPGLKDFMPAPGLKDYMPKPGLKDYMPQPGGNTGNGRYMNHNALRN